MRGLGGWLVLGLLSMASGTARAETRFPTGGVLQLSQRWTAAESPYILGADVSLGSNVTLTIEAGTVVESNPDVGLSGHPTNSRIVVEGTSDNPVIFRGRHGARWRGIEITTLSPSRFEQMEVSGAEIGLQVSGTPALVPIVGCTFSNNLKALNVPSGAIHLDRSVIQNGETGLTANAPVLISNSVFFDLSSTAVSLKGSEAESRIVNTTFGSVRSAIASTAKAIEVKNTVITDSDYAFIFAGGVSVELSAVHVHNALDGGLGVASHLVSRGDPRFLDPEAGSFLLMEDSPLINTGSPDVLASIDLRGTMRPALGAYDIGAIELPSICGDGQVSGDETCDDGNTVDGDGCNALCASPLCGNGLVDSGEECDDGNQSNNDGCLNNCRNATCGDGYIFEGVEECDDTNLSERDGCLNTCELPFCGDGVINGSETCDDGDFVDDNECPNTCGVSGGNDILRNNRPSAGGCAIQGLNENPGGPYTAILLALLALGRAFGRRERNRARRTD